MSRPASSSTAGAGPTAASPAAAPAQLLAVALTDVLSDGLSMVYSFFDPDEATARSAPS